MAIRLANDLKRDLVKIQKTDTRLAKRIEKQLALFATNPQHRSLRVHKLSGKLQNMWSISITKSIRMIYLLINDDEAYFFDIGTHDEVYKK